MNRLPAVAAALTFALTPPLPSPASDVNLSVNPLVSEVRVAPGQTDRTFTLITNNGDQDERITIRPIDWNTRIDGGISIENTGAEGQRSLTPFLEAVSYGFVLHPHESRRLDVAVSLPPAFKSVPASYWGGFYIKATAADASPIAIGPAATFFVYNDVGTPSRHLTIEALHGAAAGAGVAVSARLKNDGDGYLRIGGTVALLQNGKAVRSQPVSVGAVFPGKIRIVKSSFSGLTAGTYTLESRFDYGTDVIVIGDTKVVVP